MKHLKPLLMFDKVYYIRCKVELLSFGLTLFLQSVGNIPMDKIVALQQTTRRVL